MTKHVFIVVFKSYNFQFDFLKWRQKVMFDGILFAIILIISKIIKKQFLINYLISCTYDYNRVTAWSP